MLRHDDRVALGHCAYVLVVVDPKKASSRNKNTPTTAAAAGAAAAAGGAAGGDDPGTAAVESGAGGVGSNSNKTLALSEMGHVATFDSCVHEVMLQRSHGQLEYRQRLAAFVVAKLRLPRTRALFEEQLLHRPDNPQHVLHRALVSDWQRLHAAAGGGARRGRGLCGVGEETREPQGLSQRSVA